MWTDRLQKADVSFSASGDNTVIAGVPGKRIAIDFILFRTEGATTIQMKDGAASNYGGAFQCDRHDGMTLENTIRNHDGIVTLSTGNDFIINSTVGVQISGFVRYRFLDNS